MKLKTTQFSKEQLIRIYSRAIEILEKNEKWGHGYISLGDNEPSGLCWVLSEVVRKELQEEFGGYVFFNEWVLLVYNLEEWFTQRPYESLFYFHTKEERIHALHSIINKLQAK